LDATHGIVVNEIQVLAFLHFAWFMAVTDMWKAIIWMPARLLEIKQVIWLHLWPSGLSKDQQHGVCLGSFLYET
jgi:hypothetical protein